MSQFSTNEAVSLEKTVDLTSSLIVTEPANLDNVYEIPKIAQWVKQHDFKKVCLQFPDYMLSDSSEVALKLQQLLGQTVFVLGDTAYESCCIDYIAASHVNADCIVHFGDVCFSKTTANIPYLNVYEKLDFAIDKFASAFADFEHNHDLVVLVDCPYISSIDNLQQLINGYTNVIVSRIDQDFNITAKMALFIGDNDRKIMNTILSFQPKTLFTYKPQTATNITKYEPDSKILKRRYFLIEKIKDSKTVGIVIGTLAVKNYLKIIERIKKLVSMSGKKYYLISVGKPTVAKLANFPEIDIYVIITCAMNEIYESRDFYKPIVTPYDVEVALNTKSKDLSFSYDYNCFLNDSNLDDLQVSQSEDVSLLTGNVRSNRTDDEKLEETDKQLMHRETGQLATNDFLSSRSWRGLEQNLGQTEVKLAEEGRRGIAQGYKNEVVEK